MATDTLLSFLLFAFVTAITPGPNNILLMTSGELPSVFRLPKGGFHATSFS